MLTHHLEVLPRSPFNLRPMLLFMEGFKRKTSARLRRTLRLGGVAPGFLNNVLKVEKFHSLISVDNYLR